MFKTYDHFLDQDVVKQISLGSKSTKYPMKLMRYWITGNLILQERATKIAEVGIGRGEMKYWMNSIGMPEGIVWDGYDVNYDARLDNADYHEVFLGDATGESWALNKSYDCIILLHFLEHLMDPESFFYKIDGCLTKGGTIVGGMPSTPDCLLKVHEYKMRKSAKAFGHVSAFSKRRINEIALKMGYTVEFVSGGFFARVDGNSIENSLAWLRFNAWFASKVSSMGNEIYFKLRKN